MISPYLSTNPLISEQIGSYVFTRAETQAHPHADLHPAGAVHAAVLPVTSGAHLHAAIGLGAQGPLRKG